MAKLLVDGRLEIAGPGGGVTVTAEGEAIRVEFATVRAAASVWRRTKRLMSNDWFTDAGVAIEVYVRGVRVRRLGAKS